MVKPVIATAHSIVRLMPFSGTVCVLIRLGYLRAGRRPLVGSSLDSLSFTLVQQNYRAIAIV